MEATLRRAYGGGSEEAVPMRALEVRLVWSGDWRDGDRAERAEEGRVKDRVLSISNANGLWARSCDPRPE